MSNAVASTGKPSWLLDKKEVAQYLGVAVSTISKWVSARYIPCIKMGAFVRFDVAKVDAWLKNKLARTGSAPNSDPEIIV